jgi:hypothetical protein
MAWVWTWNYEKISSNVRVAILIFFAGNIPLVIDKSRCTPHSDTYDARSELLVFLKPSALPSAAIITSFSRPGEHVLFCSPVCNSFHTTVCTHGYTTHHQFLIRLDLLVSPSSLTATLDDSSVCKTVFATRSRIMHTDTATTPVCTRVFATQVVPPAYLMNESLFKIK